MFSSVNTCWTLVAAFLVYFMQAGFALCEAGFTRAKNTGNILMKNMMDFCIGTPCYWVIGFGLMFGGTGALIGGFDPFIQGDYSHLGLDIPLWVYIVFQTVFCATAATIVSGSMAERTNFKAYCVYSAAISLVVYPICGHWMWGGGCRAWASMTLPVPQPCTTWAASSPCWVPGCWAPASASTTRTASPTPSPATT